MVLTSSYRRRTAGFTALFAALLLVLTAVFTIAPAAAASLPDPEDNPTGVDGNAKCGHYGLDEVAYFNAPKANASSNGVSITITASKEDGATAFTWTSTEYISLVIVKASNEGNLYAYQPPVKSGSAVTVDNHAISHLSFCKGHPVEATPEMPGFTDPDCDTAADVDLPETVGVDYGIVGDVAPGETVTVTATPQAGYEFPEDAKTTWDYTFPTVSEDCEEPTAVTPDEPTFTNSTCEDNAIGLVVPADTDAVTYTVSGDQEPGGIVTVTATLAEGYVLADGAKDEWKHTYGPLATDCEEPTAVTPDEPTFTDPTCDVQTVGLDLPADTDAVTYTVSGDQEPGGTVTVTATLAEGYVLADGATTEWVNTYGDVPTNCGGVGESVVDPAASVSVTCDAATLHLDNRNSTGDKDVTYTITGVDGYDTVVVPAGTDQTIDIVSTLSEDVAYDITVSAEGMEDATAAGTYDCVTPSTDVSPDVVEKPAPDPAPTKPAVQAAAQAAELPATGLGSTELLLLALLMLGLGTAALLGSDPRRQN